MGIPSSSHISLKISVRVSVMTSPPAFSIPALTPSAPGAFPDFMLFIADFTSFAVGGSMLTSRSSSLSGMSYGFFFVEDGLEVRFPQLCLFFYIRYHHPVCIFHWNVTVSKTSS